MNTAGIDIIETERISDAIKEWQARFLQRVFTSAELEYCRGRVESLAARFACKEAVTKALGADFIVPSWKEIEILTNKDGIPGIVLHGETKIKASRSGYTRFAVSMSHCKAYAVAVCYAS